ncbi:circadian clock KaiB family protein [Sphingomonas sp.]|uniref:circadian clock KaiB family protein n=1 Tax=Sphingomonas sp. TaxID=28214 RepID=UPI003CC6B7A9
MSDAAPGDGDGHVLKLFVSGATPRSTQAITNLRRLLERELPGAYRLEVIDIYQNPQAARDHQVVAAPTLVKLMPLPIRRMIGDLSDAARVLSGLGVMPQGGPA